jgi:two-component system, chemotaxis family, protein-glutamate methylesterase/glutaminase
MKHDLILIGGSAGSIRVLQTVIGALPKNLPAVVCAIIHTTPRGRSTLPQLLNLSGSLPAVQASDNAALVPGRIYVAPPDRHMLIGHNHIHLTRGPKEGLHRPSINISFRSAAQAYGQRVVGVLLSGMLDDGASGLWEIGRHGGVTVIQDPSEAEFPSMPLNALMDAPVHFKLSSEQIGPILERMVRGEEVPTLSPSGNEQAHEHFSGFTCPECRGPLYQKRLGKSLEEFRCRVGHIFSPKVLLEEHTSIQERKLYEAIVALEEGADLAEHMAKTSDAEQRNQFQIEAEQLRHHSAAIRRMIEERVIPSADPPAELQHTN